MRIELDKNKVSQSGNLKSCPAQQRLNFFQTFPHLNKIKLASASITPGSLSVEAKCQLGTIQVVGLNRLSTRVGCVRNACFRDWALVKIVFVSFEESNSKMGLQLGAGKAHFREFRRRKIIENVILIGHRESSFSWVLKKRRKYYRKHIFSLVPEVK